MRRSCGRHAAAIALALGLCAGAHAETAVEARLSEAELHVRTRNQAAAIEIWRELAARDVREAQYRLGVAYRAGRGVPTDHARAADLLERSAKSGHPGAAFALGTLYQKGWGVEADRAQALEWFGRASSLGHPVARRRLEALAGSDSIAELTGSSRLGARSGDPDAVLALAIREGDATAALDALQRGASPKHRDERGHTPLHTAAQHGHARIAQSLLKYRAPVDAADARGVTPLMLATEGGHAKTLRVLLEAGALRDARDALGRSALMLGAAVGQQEVVALLLGRGADASLALEDGRRAYDLATRAGHDDIARLLAARGAGARPRATGRDREAWLREQAETSGDASMPPLVAAAWRGQEELVASLLARSNARSALRERDARGHTALSRAAEAGHTAIVSMLLDAGADVSAATPDGRAVLSWSATADRDVTIRRLLRAGASLTATDDGGRTALSHAAERGAVNAVASLLEAGAPLGTNETSNAPLVLAAIAGELEVLELLAAKDDDRTRQLAALCGALRAGSDTNVAKRLAERWPGLARASCADGTGPLDLAARNGSLDAVRALLRAGADPNGTDARNVPPLLLAARRGDSRMIALLLDTGADVNARGPARETALTESATAGHEEASALLLDRGADAGARTAAGYTAAELASRRGHEGTAERIDQASQSLGKLLWSDD